MSPTGAWALAFSYHSSTFPSGRPPLIHLPPPPFAFAYCSSTFQLNAGPCVPVYSPTVPPPSPVAPQIFSNFASCGQSLSLGKSLNQAGCNLKVPTSTWKMTHCLFMKMHKITIVVSDDPHLLPATVCGNSPNSRG